MSKLPSIKQDVLGRLSKIAVPKNNALQAVFEAVANAYDSLVEDKIGDNITLEIIRHPQELSLTEQKDSCSIFGFKIIDNGVGFNPKNFAYFCKVDSRHKAAHGGKGIGHLTWVKTFHEVTIESQFSENNQTFLRTALLIEDENIFSQHELRQIDDCKPITTIVLRNLKEGFNAFPKTHVTLCDLFFCHFLPRILTNKEIKFIIKDEGQETVLNGYLAGHNKLGDKPIKIKGETFRFFFLKTLKSRSNAGKIHYCAASRVVMPEKLTNFNRFVAGLSESYAGYILGNFLDKNVLEERLGFKIQEEASEMMGIDIGWKDIRESVSRMIDDFIKDTILPHQQEHKSNVKKFVEINPRYRTVLSRNEKIIDEIPLNASTEEMISIFEVERQKIRLQSAMLIKNTSLDQSDISKEKIDILRQAIVDNVTLSKDTLSDYVLDRKSIISLLESQLRKNSDNSIPLEKEIHNLIFPMRKTSDDVEFDEHNLWLVDDRLAFHKFLTSDRALSSDFSIKSRKEPDILCYIDEPIKNYFSSATLIEFKRPIVPGHHYDPVGQIKKMVNDLRDSNCSKEGGRKINFAPNAHFFGYIITDIDEHILSCIRIDGNLKKNSRGDGYFHYYETMGLRLEVVSYDKLLGDAEKRNQIFFQKLGLES